jgi:hypothetical protein
VGQNSGVVVVQGPAVFMLSAAVAVREGVGAGKVASVALAELGTAEMHLTTAYGTENEAKQNKHKTTK